MSIKVRPSFPLEWASLPMPIPPATVLVIVAEDVDSKEIKGVWPVQLVLHIEPVWMHDGLSSTLQGGRVGLEMYSGLLAMFANQGIEEFYAFADRPDIASYLERMGLQLQPYVIYKGTVPPLPTPLNDAGEKEVI